MPNADHMQKELTTKLIGVNTAHKKVNGHAKVQCVSWQISTRR